MDGDVHPFFTGILASHFSIETQEFLLDNMILLPFSQLVHQKTLHMIFKYYLEQVQYGLRFPVFPLIRRSCVPQLAASITFAPIFNLRNFAKHPVCLFLILSGLNCCQWVFTIIWNFVISLYCVKLTRKII